MGHYHIVIINDLLTPPSDQPSLDDLANVLSFSLADTMDEAVHDEARHFMECHQISNESQFLVDSLPNVETAVERACRQLNAIRVILLALNDPHSSAQQMADLIANLDSLLYPLDDFLSNPPLPPHTHIPLNLTGKSVRIHGATWPDFLVFTNARDLYRQPMKRFKWFDDILRNLGKEDVDLQMPSRCGY
ncbi:hypothetical protein B0H14DRAFT_2565607 [Mycena olivaceomarginata]|nr:hypothetical protein B0H14DRAFT_2565607 [Mycena olivaceomarginata]